MTSLFRLHRKAFSEVLLTTGEVRLLESTMQGRVAVLPPEASTDSQKRRVGAYLIEWLCTDSKARNLVHRHGIRVQNAVVDDQVDISYCTIGFPLEFRRSRFLKGFCVSGSEGVSLNLQGSVVGSLSAKGAAFAANLDLQYLEVKGTLELHGTTVGGDLHLEGAKLRNPRGDAALLEQATIGGTAFLCGKLTATGLIRMTGSTVAGDLRCSMASIVGLVADSCEIGGSVYLNSGFTCQGTARFYEAKIKGDFICHGGVFKNVGSISLLLDGIQIQGSLYLDRGFWASGEVRLPLAYIDGDMSCDGGRFLNPGGDALSLDAATVRGDVRLANGFAALGEVRLCKTTVGRDVDCRASYLINPGGEALSAREARIRGSMYFGDESVVSGVVSLRAAEVGTYLTWRDISSLEGMSLDLTHAKARLLQDDSSSWPEPGSLLLHGFEYEDIHPESPTRSVDRLNWLKRIPEELFTTQPYERLARLYGLRGLDRDKKAVLVAKNRHPSYRGSLPCLSRFAHDALGAIVGFGYRPAKALLWIGLVICLGFVLAFTHPHLFAKATPENTPEPGLTGMAVNIANPIQDQGGGQRDSLPSVITLDQALIWSIDLFVPLLDIGIADELRPSGWLRIYSCFHAILGWLLTSMLVAGVTGALRR